MKKTASVLLFITLFTGSFSASAQWTTKQNPGTGIDYVHRQSATRLVASSGLSFFYSDNNGQNWTAAPTNQNAGEVRTDFAMSSSGMMVAGVTTAALVLSLPTGPNPNGASWTLVSPSDFEDKEITQLTARADTFYAVLGEPTASNIWRSVATPQGLTS